MEEMIEGGVEEGFVSVEGEFFGEVGEEGDVGGVCEGGHFCEGFLAAGGEVEGVGVFEMGLGFEGGEFEELVDEFFAAFCLATDVADEAGAVGLGHVFV